VADLIETQEDLFEASDVTNEPEVSQVTQEEQVQSAPAVEDIPPKYKGKSLDEIIRMHQEAEKLIGRQAQEVGEVRKLADELIKRQIEPKKVEETVTKEDEIDFFEDPDKAVARKIDSHPAIQEARQQALQLKQMQTLDRLQKNFPDFQQTVQDTSFAEWINASPVRVRLFAQANAEYDYDAASELLTSWSYVKPKAPVQEAVPSAEVKQAQRAAVKAATVDVGGSSQGNTSSKVYRRADLIRLQIENPNRYYELQDEIMAAYNEGRVK
jgi:hypothetical protein